MGMFSSMGKVARARARVVVARNEVVVPAAALIARGYENPLTVLGVAAGSGFLLSKVKLNPLAVPGVSGLVAGGTADLLGKVITTAVGSLVGNFAGGSTDDDDIDDPA